MSDLDPRSPAERPRQRTTEPAEMSVAEKLACEREARHDVLGRGRITDVAPVQHYLTHTRCEDSRHPSGEGRTRPHTSPRTDEPDKDVTSWLRGWVRWGEEGRPGTPVIPRC